MKSPFLSSFFLAIAGSIILSVGFLIFPPIPLAIATKELKKEVTGGGGGDGEGEGVTGKQRGMSGNYQFQLYIYGCLTPIGCIPVQLTSHHTSKNSFFRVSLI